MDKRKEKEQLNLYSLIIGIFFIVIGLVSFAMTISIKKIIFIPIIVLIIGAFLALMGGLRKLKD